MGRPDWTARAVICEQLRTDAEDAWDTATTKSSAYNIAAARSLSASADAALIVWALQELTNQ